jgi:hypothetical protein
MGVGAGPGTETILVDNLYRHAPAVQLDSSNHLAPGTALNSILFRLPERVDYEDDDDIIIHIVADGERLYDIAQFHYGTARNNPWDMWEVIAQFQPEPILDPSVILETGREIYIPSSEFIEEVAYGPTLTDTPKLW